MNLKRERYEVVDVVRGAAIFGILLVNMAHFSYPDVYLYQIGSENFFTETWRTWDFLTKNILEIFVQMKFITMFSLLFGFGIIIMEERALGNGRNFVSIYIRRLVVLFVFGLIHSFFIWDGDILMDYAVLGFLLLFFRKCSWKTLLVWTVCLFSLYLLLIGLMTAVSNGEDALVQKREQAALLEEEARNAIHSYQNGSFTDIFHQRIHDRLFYMSMSGMWPFQPLVYIINMLPYISMFLVGMIFAKQKLFQEPEKHRRLLTAIWFFGLIIGLPLNIFAVTAENSFYMVFGAPFLMLFYVTSLIFLYFHPICRQIVKKIAPVGRMSLTNYIMQSVICTYIFYHYGLGLYGKVYPFAGFWLALAIFAVQLIISHIWFKYFQLGPLEWVWRTAMYFKRQPIRMKKEVLKHNNRSR